MKKLKLLLVLSLFITLFPMQVHASESSIRSQVVAFAKSINQSNADDSAAAALASHGIKGRGKTLNVGKNHALTATLMNSNQVQEALVDSITRSIEFMQDVGLKHVFLYGNVHWYDDYEKNYYALNLMDSDNASYTNRDFQLCKVNLTKKNAYDESLDWMAGHTDATMYVDLYKVSGNEATYRIKFNINDLFDFSTSTSNGFKNLISGIGAILFTEFEWNSTVTFDIKVPYTPCDHKTDVFKLTYDSNKNMIVSNNETGISNNQVTQHTILTSAGNTRYYYELEDMIELYANRPWVFEYDINRFSSLSLSSTLSSHNKNYPSLYHQRGSDIRFVNTKYVKLSDSIVKEYDLKSSNSYIDYYHGLNLSSIPIDKNSLYTYRYENILDKNGNNMIYLTIIETNSGNVLVDKVPMNDTYSKEVWSKKETIISNESDYFNGQNIYFKYIGKEGKPFTAGEFELRVWENGKENTTDSAYVATKVVKPTCSAKGYTEYTCNKCGHVTKKDYVNKIDHQYTSSTIKPTCTSDGYTEYKCKQCGDTYKDEYTSKLGHVFTNYIINGDGTSTSKCDRCDAIDTRMDVIYGDVNNDGKVNQLDRMALARYLAKWQGYDQINSMNSDVDNDSKINQLDRMTLARYLAKWQGYETLPYIK